MRVRPLSVALLLLPLLTGGCIIPIVGGATAVGVGAGAVQERGFEGAMDDTKIGLDINQLWLSEDFTVFKDVSTTISEGRVMLTGTVKKAETRAEAVRLTWQAAGVRQVFDEIQVTDQTDFMDYTHDSIISADFKTRLLTDSKIRNVNYQYEVVNGVVYILGIAQNKDELDRVIAHARDIDNVKRVIDHIVLKDDPRRFAS